MKLKLAKKKQMWNLILCIAWLGLGIFSFIENDSTFSRYSYLVLGLLYLGMVVYNHIKQFGKIENDRLIINGWKSKELDLKSLTEARHFAGDLILKTDNNQVTIPKDAITEESLLAVQNNEYVKIILEKN